MQRCAALHRRKLKPMGRSIPAYICGSCGKGFASARSARRHVRTLEQGRGQIYSETQYRIMLTTGVILPPMPKASTPSYHKKGQDLSELGKEEFIRGYYRRLGELAIENSNPVVLIEFTKFMIQVAGIDMGKSMRSGT